jgi:hypothetical protein
MIALLPFCILHKPYIEGIWLSGTKRQALGAECGMLWHWTDCGRPGPDAGAY